MVLRSFSRELAAASIMPEGLVMPKGFLLRTRPHPDEQWKRVAVQKLKVGIAMSNSERNL